MIYIEDGELRIPIPKPIDPRKLSLVQHSIIDRLQYDFWLEEVSAFSYSEKCLRYFYLEFLRLPGYPEEEILELKFMVEEKDLDKGIIDQLEIYQRMLS